jgi:hypothetical protein
MVGVPSGKCDFTECQYALNWGVLSERGHYGRQYGHR